jgi:pantetheine-phosphate adenylyltransferase
MRKAIYAGSFDPITRGHLWMIEIGSKIFDELIIVVGNNPLKNGMFSFSERSHLVTGAVSHIKNVTVKQIGKEFVADFAKRNKVNFLIRGMRNENDYSQERDMKYLNAKFNNQLETIFLIPPKELSEISSSLVKSLIGLKEWEKRIPSFVNNEVANAIIFKYLNPIFEKSLKTLGVSDFSTSPVVLKDLIKRYKESHRYYHSISHILDCINELMENFSNLSERDLGIAVLVLLFHDAIYDTHANNNEEKSADLFKSFAGSLLDPDSVNLVYQIILATKNHSLSNVADTNLGQIILDIDLSILGKDIDTFNNYDENIRKEYSWVDESTYHTTRHKIMNNFLTRNKIFLSDKMNATYEHQAKINLQKYK